MVIPCTRKIKLQVTGMFQGCCKSHDLAELGGQGGDELQHTLFNNTEMHM